MALDEGNVDAGISDSNPARIVTSAQFAALWVIQKQHPPTRSEWEVR